MHLLVETTAVAALATLIGIETCVAVFFHPALQELALQPRLTGRASSARRLGRVMPLHYFAAVAAAGSAAVVAPAGRWWWGSCAIALAATVAVTVVLLVPLNDATARLDPAEPPQDVSRLLARWDTLHRYRTGFLILLLAGDLAAMALA